MHKVFDPLRGETTLKLDFLVVLLSFLNNPEDFLCDIFSLGFLLRLLRMPFAGFFCLPNRWFKRQGVAFWTATSSFVSRSLRCLATLKPIRNLDPSWLCDRPVLLFEARLMALMRSADEAKWKRLSAKSKTLGWRCRVELKEKLSENQLMKNTNVVLINRLIVYFVHFLW